MYKIMVVVRSQISPLYLPITAQEDKADAEQDIEMLRELNPQYKFAIMEEADGAEQPTPRRKRQAKEE